MLWMRWVAHTLTCLAAVEASVRVVAAAAQDGARAIIPAVLTSPNSKDCQAGWNFGTAAQIWISAADLAKLGISTTGVTPGGGSMLVSTESITGCHNWTIRDITAPSGSDACGTCGGCELGLVRFEMRAGCHPRHCSVRPGAIANLSYIPGPSPPPQPPSPPAPPPGQDFWEHVGPRNIFDDVENRGEAGTLADAASPILHPDIIYTGGKNNGASSGVLKTVDRGKTWVPSSNGLLDTRVSALFVHPDDSSGNHVLVGTADSQIWESSDGAATWHFLKESQSFGAIYTFRVGQIQGQEYVLVATGAGIANVPVAGGNWSLIPGPGQHNAFSSVMSVSAPDEPESDTGASSGSSTVCGCIGGRVVTGVLTGPTAAKWFKSELECFNAAIDPTNSSRVLFSRSADAVAERADNRTDGDSRHHNRESGRSNTSDVHEQLQSESREGGSDREPALKIRTWLSSDGGKTAELLPSNTPSFRVAIDERGWLYQASENPVLCDFGTNGQQWEAYVNVMTMRANHAPHNRSEHDYQNIVVGNGAPGTVFFTSDQGLFIKPSGRNTTLISANGNMSNNIAIGLAVSAGAADQRYIVITAWDWSPLASWSSGDAWHTPCSNWGVPSTPTNPRICDRGGVAGVGEGGTVIGMGRSNHVVRVSSSLLSPFFSLSFSLSLFQCLFLSLCRSLSRCVSGLLSLPQHILLFTRGAEYHAHPAPCGRARA